MSISLHHMVAHLAARPHRQTMKVANFMPRRYRAALRLIQTQLPAIAALTATLTLLRFIDLASGTYTVIILFLLIPTVYTPLRFGLRPGMVGAFILVAFNAYLVWPVVDSLTLTDPGVRTIALIGFVLPFLAFIIGRLKERNNYLFRQERAARLQAEENEQRLRFMAEAMPQKIFTSRPDGTSDYANRQWMEYTGVHPDTVEGDGWSELIHPADSAENIRRWEHSLTSGEPFEYEHRLRRSDGTYRWHITRALPMHDEDGALIQWVGSSTDIEDIRRTRKLEADTARLTKQRAELLTLNTAKDEFISLASHQLRTPATGVKQYLGMVLEGYGGRVPKSQLKLLRQAYASNERQLRIVDDLLKVAQVDAGKVKLNKEAVDVVALIKDIIRGQTDKFTERDQTVIFKPRRRNITVPADAERLRMVLDNIVDNASKYSPVGKTVEVRAVKSKGTLVISVRDEGVGIDSRDMKRIFDKFARLDNPLSVLVGGTGLGLYWAKKIIDLHDGSILIDSKPGKGSTFSVTLPAK